MHLYFSSPLHFVFKNSVCEGIKVEAPRVGLFTVDFCPGDQGLHQVSHHQKVNVPAIPKEGEGGGVQMIRALSDCNSAFGPL